MPKNIIVCCDGTGNEYGDHNSNVLKLYAVLPKNTPEQVTFYDPGLGTLSSLAAITRTVRFITKAFGNAFGLGITSNIADAYQFLMRSYKPGDRVYLFGFSRGAYTVRAVAAMLHKCGLLDSRNDNLIPYALKIFKHERRSKIYRGFRRAFSRECPVHFMGLWDTVKSAGWIYDPLTLQFTMNNPSVKAVRQALAIDERRCFFRQNLWGNAEQGQDVKQVWFAGVHSDIGGGYPERECGLSQIALKWMIEEAKLFGMEIDPQRYATVVPELTQPAPDSGMTVTPEREYHAPPDYKGQIHRSLGGWWWIAEFLPKMYQDPRKDFKKSFMLPCGRPRFMQEGSLIHKTVQDRMLDTAMAYSPTNLPKQYPVAP